MRVAVISDIHSNLPALVAVLTDIESLHGSPDELWTNKMAEEFRAWREYPLIPNLPALFQDIFSFNEGSAPRVRNRLYAVRGDIWIAKQLAPCARFPAERIGLPMTARSVYQCQPGHRSQRCGISVY